MPRSFFYTHAMRPNLVLPMVAVALAFAFTGCADAEKKPVGPVSETSKIPWNVPQAGQGQGQMGMMPQNQYRR